MSVEPKAQQRKSPAKLSHFLMIVGTPVLLVMGVGWWSGAWRPAPVVGLVTSTDSPYWDRVVMGAQRAAVVMDPVEGELKGPEYTVVGTAVDGADPAKATELVREALRKEPDLKCVVGLFGYSTPAILGAMKEAGVTGKVKVVGFDEAAETLGGIEDGTVAGTILQDQYNMGYNAVGAMYQAMMVGKGVKEVARYQYVPARAVRDKEDVKVLRYEREREARAGKGEGEGGGGRWGDDAGGGVGVG